MATLVDNVKKSIFLLLFLLLTGLVIYFFSLNKTKILFYDLREYTLNNDIKSLQILLDDRLREKVLNEINIKLISKKLKGRKVKKISIDGFNIEEKTISSIVYFSDNFIDFSITYVNGSWVISQINFSH
jgi:hypothetical protein